MLAQRRKKFLTISSASPCNLASSRALLSIAAVACKFLASLNGVEGNVMDLLISATLSTVDSLTPYRPRRSFLGSDQGT